jgi:hypothetical protein
MQFWLFLCYRLPESLRFSALSSSWESHIRRVGGAMWTQSRGKGNTQLGFGQAVAGQGLGWCLTRKARQTNTPAASASWLAGWLGSSIVIIPAARGAVGGCGRNEAVIMPSPPPPGRRAAFTTTGGAWWACRCMHSCARRRSGRRGSISISIHGSWHSIADHSPLLVGHCITSLYCTTSMNWSDPGAAPN